MSKALYLLFILSLMSLGAAVAVPFDPEPSQPPVNTSGTGTR